MKILGRAGIGSCRGVQSRKYPPELRERAVRVVAEIRTEHESERAADLVARQLAPTAPDRLWVAGITYVSTWSGRVYTAFVIDAYVRRILGWRCGTTMSTQLVLDALNQAIWPRTRTGASLEPVVAQSDRGSQYTSLRYGERLAEAGISPPVGSVGDSFDKHGYPCQCSPQVGFRASLLISVLPRGVGG
jgi:putative transposase